MLDTVAEKIFRIITTVEDDDAVLINIERFQILQMFHGGSAFRSKIALERGMNDIVVKNIINDGSKAHGKPSGRIRITEHFAEEFKIGRRIWKLNFGTINGKKMVTMMLSRLVDTFFSRTSWTMLPYVENHSISVA